MGFFHYFFFFQYYSTQKSYWNSQPYNIWETKHTQENTAEEEDSWKQETLRGEWKYVKTKEVIDCQGK